jgi:hypothetical protein
MSEVTILGQKFGSLTAVQRSSPIGIKNITWEFLCDCGNLCVMQKGAAKLRYYDLHRAYLENEDKMLIILRDSFQRKRILMGKAMQWRPDAIRGLAVQSSRRSK